MSTQSGADQSTGSAGGVQPCSAAASRSPSAYPASAATVSGWRSPSRLSRTPAACWSTSASSPGFAWAAARPAVPTAAVSVVRVDRAATAAERVATRLFGTRMVSEANAARRGPTSADRRIAGSSGGAATPSAGIESPVRGQKSGTRTTQQAHGGTSWDTRPTDRTGLTGARRE